jgi:hypothetical protein
VLNAPRTSTKVDIEDRSGPSDTAGACKSVHEGIPQWRSTEDPRYGHLAACVPWNESGFGPAIDPIDIALVLSQLFCLGLLLLSNLTPPVQMPFLLSR